MLKFKCTRSVYRTGPTGIPEFEFEAGQLYDITERTKRQVQRGNGEEVDAEEPAPEAPAAAPAEAQPQQTAEAAAAPAPAAAKAKKAA